MPLLRLPLALVSSSLPLSFSVSFFASDSVWQVVGVTSLQTRVCLFCLVCDKRRAAFLSRMLQALDVQLQLVINPQVSG